MRLLFAVIIAVILIAPIGLNLTKLAISLSWSEERIVGGVGHDFAMAVDSGGIVHLAFPGPYGLAYANNSGGTWAQHQFGGNPSFCGIDVGLAGAVHIAAVVYNNGTRELAYLSNALGNWQLSWIDTGVWGYPVSIAMDSEGHAHISYTKVGLMYATNRGTGWNVTPLSTYDAGWSSDIAVDSLDRIHIVSSSGHIGHFVLDEGEWAHESVFSGDLVLNSVAIVLDDSDCPHVSYFGGNSLVDEWGLQYAVRSDGNWTSTTVEKLVSYSHPSCSIAVDSNGGVHIAYVKLESDELKYVKIVNGNKQSTILDRSAGGGITACGLGLDSEGYLHLSYVSEEHTLSYLTTEPPHMFFGLLLHVAVLKAALCVPFVIGYVLWLRRTRRNQESRHRFIGLARQRE